MINKQFRVLFHWPLPLAVISIVTYGAILSPVFNLWRLVLTYLMVFFGLVLAAYSIDALYSDWKDLISLSDNVLKATAIVGLIGFIVVAAYETVVISWTGIIVTLLIVAAVILYNTNNKYLHNKYGFSVTWGGMVAVLSYYYQSLSIGIIVIPLFITAFLIAMQEWYTTNRAAPIQKEISKMEKGETRRLLRRETFRSTSLMCYSNIMIAITLLTWRMT